jgi:hypothetical protein
MRSVRARLSDRREGGIIPELNPEGPIVSATALHGAAALLLSEAPTEVVKQILRLLLEVERTTDRMPAAIAPAVANQVATGTPAARQTLRRRPAASALDPQWESLRREVRTAMAERGTTYGQLAEVIGCAEITAKITLNRTRPASKRLIAGLRQWLEAPVAVVTAPGAPFRAGRGNGAAAHRGDSASASTAS